MNVLLLAAMALPAPIDHLVQSGQSIQAAVDGAVNGDRILVEAGTYQEQVSFNGKQIQVIGIEGPTATVIDGSTGFGPVVNFHFGEGAGSVLRGFTITNGMAFGSVRGAGVSCVDTSRSLTMAAPTISDCIIRDNFGSFGGGVAGNPTMERCLVIENTASSSDGGGVWGAPNMTDCVVALNVASDGYGGGLHLNRFADSSAHATIKDCVIYGNRSEQSSRGGGIYVADNTSATIENALLAFNDANGLSFPGSVGAFSGLGGAVAVEASAGSVNLNRCTVYRNFATISQSGTENAAFWGPMSVTNSIVRNNLPVPDFGADSFLTFSNVEGGSLGAGVIDQDPLFVDAVNLDFHLRAGSPSIDTGGIGDPDPDGTAADMGLYPFQSFYALDNAPAATWTDPAWSEISVQLGGKQRMGIDAGNASAGELYWVLGSATGTVPGVILGAGIQLPLAVDAYFNYTLSHPGGAPLKSSIGFLDTEGRATASFGIPANTDPSLAGLTLNHAYFTYDFVDQVTTGASNALSVSSTD